MKVTFEELKGAFYRVLRSRNIAEDTADECAEMFARTTESGVYSHGVNRFPRFIQHWITATLFLMLNRSGLPASAPSNSGMLSALSAT